MSGHQQATIEDTVYFWFAANDTSGSGGDGATPLFDVREAGATAGAIPLLSGTPTLLTHANYPSGCHEIAVAATTGNGFAAADTFGVFCTLAIDSQNPSGFVGSCTLTPLATVAALATAQTDLDTITGSDGATLATSQGNYAPAKAGDSMALAAGAITDASLAGNMEIVFETDFATNYNTTRNAWVTNYTDVIGTGGWNVGKTGYSLTATTGLGAQTANITGNLSGSVGSVTGAVGSVAGNVDGNVTGSVASNLELGPAEVNAEMVDVVFTDTDAEPGQGTPGATISLADKIGYLYKAWRNRSNQTATTYQVFNDDATIVDHKATVSDNGTTTEKGVVATGP